VDWSTLADLTDSVSQGNGLETVTYGSPNSFPVETRQFLRVRVIRNP